MPYTPDLDRLLTPGGRWTDEHGSYAMEVHPVGPVALPSGRVIGCDPLVYPESEPFTVGVPPGSYPARAWVAVVLRDDGAEIDRRVAALELVVLDAPTVGWEMAVAGDQELASLDADDFFGYGVDSGTGTLADPAAMAVLESWDQDQIEAVFLSTPPEGPVPGLVDVVVDEVDGANVVTVSSGWGDGCYGTWIGRDADGRVTSFVTDFMVVPRST